MSDISLVFVLSCRAYEFKWNHFLLDSNFFFLSFSFLLFTIRSFSVSFLFLLSFIFAHLFSPHIFKRMKRRQQATMSTKCWRDKRNLLLIRSFFFSFRFPLAGVRRLFAVHAKPTTKTRNARIKKKTEKIRYFGKCSYFYTA